MADQVIHARTTEQVTGKPDCQSLHGMRYTWHEKLGHVSEVERRQQRAAWKGLFSKGEKPP